MNAQEIDIDYYLAIFEASPLGVCFVSADGTVLGLNPGAFNITGYKSSELVGKKGLDFEHPDEMAVSQENSRKIMEGEINTFELEKRYIHKKGHTIWAKTIVSPIIFKDVVPSVLMVFFMDVTAIKQAQIESEKKKKLLQTAIETTNSIITILELDGKVAYVNNVAPGVNKEEFIGSSIYDYLPPKLSNDIKQNIKQVIDQNASTHYENAYVDPMGTKHYYYHIMSPVRSEGELTSVSIVSNEMTEEMAVEGKLSKDKDLARFLMGINFLKAKDLKG